MFGVGSFSELPFSALPAASGTVTLTPALFTNSNTFYTPVVGRGTVTLTPALFTNSNTFFTPVVGRAIRPALFVNSNTFFGVFCYLYPFHPNDLRPGGGSIVPGPREPLPAAPAAARGAMPAAFAPRAAMPPAPNASRASMPTSPATPRQPMPAE